MVKKCFFNETTAYWAHFVVILTIWTISKCVKSNKRCPITTANDELYVRHSPPYILLHFLINYAINFDHPAIFSWKPSSLQWRGLQQIWSPWENRQISSDKKWKRKKTSKQPLDLRAVEASQNAWNPQRQDGPFCTISRNIFRPQNTWSKILSLNSNNYYFWQSFTNMYSLQARACALYKPLKSDAPHLFKRSINTSSNNSLVWTIIWFWFSQIVVCNLAFIVLQSEIVGLCSYFRKLKVLRAYYFWKKWNLV